MNYCFAAFAIILMASAVQWWMDGRKNYTGPNLDLDALHNGEVMALVPDNHDDNKSPDVDGGGKVT